MRAMSEEATFEEVDSNFMFASEMGVSGGEDTCPGLLSICLEICKLMPLWLLDGIEKLLGTTKGGEGCVGGKGSDIKIDLS